jgi:hypothetical protein
MGVIFAFTYTCTHFCTIFTYLSPFPATSPHHWCQCFPLPQRLFSLLFSNFVEVTR